MIAGIFPGQGAQYKGMGKDLFPLYPELVKQASSILGYDIEQLCLNDPDNQLSKTNFTQPAQFLVNALAYYNYRDNTNSIPDYFLGHSLGEYNALLAAEVFDFKIGLQLVAKRGELMGGVDGGSMIAILNKSIGDIEDFLRENDLKGIDIANYNSLSQIVVSGKSEEIKFALNLMDEAGMFCVQLNVQSPFHSRYMKEASEQFGKYASQFTFNRPCVPVIANTSTCPYSLETIKPLLCKQIVQPVLWYESVTKLLDKHSNIEFLEMGGSVLTKMIKNIRKVYTPKQALTPSKAILPERKVTLFCIAHAGGDFRTFLPLKKRLESTIEVIVLERSGHGRRLADPLHTDFDIVVDDLFSQLPTSLDKPYAIFGHSFGARLAYRLCQRIREKNLQLPLHLFVSGDRSPETNVLEKETHTLDSEQFWIQLKKIGSYPLDFFENTVLHEFFEKIIRADLKALSSYTHRTEAAFDFPITAMIGEDEPITTEEANLWRHTTNALFSLQVYSGGHFFIKEHIRKIAQNMTTSLEESSFAARVES